MSVPHELLQGPGGDATEMRGVRGPRSCSEGLRHPGALGASLAPSSRNGSRTAKERRVPVPLKKPLSPTAGFMLMR